MVRIEDENGKLVDGEELEAAFAFFENKHGYKPGTFKQLKKEALKSEAARWEIMLGSDFHLFPTVSEVAAC